MKRILITLFISISMLFSFSSCNTGEDVDEAQEAAYDIGYNKGYEFGYAAGYVDSANGKNINVFSEIEEDDMNEDMVFFIVGNDKKIYHTIKCSELEGKQYSYFKTIEEAESAGFDSCDLCN